MYIYIYIYIYMVNTYIKTFGSPVTFQAWLNFLIINVYRLCIFLRISRACNNAQHHRVSRHRWVCLDVCMLQQYGAALIGTSIACHRVYSTIHARSAWYFHSRSKSKEQVPLQYPLEGTSTIYLCFFRILVREILSDSIKSSVNLRNIKACWT